MFAITITYEMKSLVISICILLYYGFLKLMITIHRCSTMKNHNANFTSLVQDSSASPFWYLSFSSSSNGFSFILEDSDNDIMPIVQDLLEDETDN